MGLIMIIERLVLTVNLLVVLNQVDDLTKVLSLPCWKFLTQLEWNESTTRWKEFVYYYPIDEKYSIMQNEWFVIICWTEQ